MNASPGSHTRAPSQNANGFALVARPRDQGEEPSSRHRVGPWSPVIPVELVPALVGGDRHRRNRLRECALGPPRDLVRACEAQRLPRVVFVRSPKRTRERPVWRKLGSSGIATDFMFDPRVRIFAVELDRDSLRSAHQLGQWRIRLREFLKFENESTHSRGQASSWVCRACNWPKRLPTNAHHCGAPICTFLHA